MSALVSAASSHLRSTESMPAHADRSDDAMVLDALSRAFRNGDVHARTAMARDATLVDILLGHITAAAPLPSGPPPTALRLLRNLVATAPETCGSCVAVATGPVKALVQAWTDNRAVWTPAASGAMWQLLANTMAAASVPGARYELWALLAPTALAAALAEAVPDVAAACAAMIVYNFALHTSDGLAVLMEVEAVPLLRSALLLMERDAHGGQPATWAWLLADLVVGSDRFGDAYNALGVLAVTEGLRAHPGNAEADNAEAESTEGGANAATVSVDAAAPAATRATLESAEGVMARTALLKYIEARTADDCGDRVAMSAPTLRFLLERWHLLAYLAQDEAWWRNPQHAARALQLALVVRILANVAAFGAGGGKLTAGQVIAAAEHVDAATAGIDLLREMSPWSKRQTPAKGASAAASGMQQPLPANPTPPGFKSDILRLLANIVYRSSVNQNAILTAGGVPVLLNCFLHDDHNPLMREWAVMAVRNLCEGNETAQAEVASYQRTTATPSSSAAPAHNEQAASGQATERVIDSINIEVDEETGLTRPTKRT